MARLSIFTVGLTRIELVTSSLSGMRSNRLSYSPRRVTAVGKPYRRDGPTLNREGQVLATSSSRCWFFGP